MASSQKTSICLRSVINHILFELHVLKCWACGKSVEDATMRSKTPVWFEAATVVRRRYCGSKALLWFEDATVVGRCYCSSKTLLWFEGATVGSKTQQWVEDPTLFERPCKCFVDARSLVQASRVASASKRNFNTAYEYVSYFRSLIMNYKL